MTPLAAEEILPTTPMDPYSILVAAEVLGNLEREENGFDFPTGEEEAEEGCNNIPVVDGAEGGDQEEDEEHLEEDDEEEEEEEFTNHYSPTNSSSSKSSAQIAYQTPPVI